MVRVSSSGKKKKQRNVFNSTDQKWGIGHGTSASIRGKAVCDFTRR